ncbi:MAG: cobalt-zinc-cadmium efflux system outer membrane protein [Planctomycetota bacterium]|jgi:cobalt-zinc-cadmium efflux system outer membrane protein
MKKYLSGTLLMMVLIASGCSTKESRYSEWSAQPTDDTNPQAEALPTEQEAGTEINDKVVPIAQVIPSPLEAHQFKQEEDSTQALLLDAVITSVDRHFPELLAARQEIERAEGQLLASEGGFDPVLRGKGKLKRGFYDTEVFDLEIEQPTTFMGATIFGGYRYGDGNFALYNGGFETNSAGEFLLGVGIPILRGSAIDERRANLWRSRIERDATDPVVHEKRIAVIRKASKAYWKWVTAGQQVDVVKGLLDLAVTRQDKLAKGVAEGQFPSISLTENERLVVIRQVLLVAARREFERATLLLSLYFRDAEGDGIRASENAIPKSIPQVPIIQDSELADHILYGMSHRPELRLLSYAKTRGQLDVDLRENKLLPKFDLELYASQDIGGRVSPKEEFDPTEVGVGLSLEIPLRRRKARGKLRSARAKLSKIGHQYRMQADRIEAEVRDAASALKRASERVALERRDLVLALRMQEAEQVAFDEGASDLLRVNIREQATAKARATLIKFEANCLTAYAQYVASLGLPMTIK